MTHPEVVQRVQQVADRVRLVRRRFALSLAGLMSAALGLGCLGLARWLPAWTTVWQLAFATGSAALLIWAFAASRRRFADLTLALNRIEAAFPDLQARLLTAVEQQPDVWTGRYNLFQTRLLTEVGGHARTHDWTEIIPKKVMSYANRRQWVALAILCVVAWWMIRLPSPAERSSSLASMGREAASGGRSDYVVDPGDVQVERNQSLLVLIRFQHTPPRDVLLEWQPAGGAAQRLSMTKSLDDPVFAGHLATITGNGAYRLEFDGVATPNYSVLVYDLPALRHSSLTVLSPAYTQREPQVFASATSATVIEGSQVRLACRVNKPLARVELRNEVDDSVIPLAVDPSDPLTYAAQWSPDKSRKWLLTLIDGDQRTNRDPLEFQLDVIPNRRPDFKPVFPGQDQRVSALQELPLEVRVSDDFGILASGVVIDPAGREPVTVPLSGELAGGEAHPLMHLLSLESFPLEPGEIVSYAFFAEDHGPDGKPRRTLGDLFFLEIRPFDESFREMEGAGGKSNMQGASSSPSQNLDKLIELQKQIVTAAWNLARRDPDLSQPAERAAVETLRESQESAHDQFEQLSQNLAEAVPAERIRTIFEQMSRAVEEFTAAGATQKLAHLESAAQAARGAFQGLVRLRPTDHRIMKGGQSGGGGGGGGSTSQQQLEELELSGEQNRYESEKSARNPAETSQQKENLAFLNRLKELAQRQQGLNEKLKELDAELRTAQSADERRELERQLKQLRDEQQDQLQDADALRNKLEQSKNSEQTADARKQLEQTRQQLVDAAESLKEGKLGQALSSGTRAERDLQQLQDDFRKKSSAQLAEALQQLKTQAQDLTDAEEQASQELAGLNDKQEKSLRQRQLREKLAEKFQEQHARLEAALKSVRETVEAAEATEPLAAKKLYEAARQAQQHKTEQALNAAEQLVRQGFLPEATQAEQIAKTGLQTLRDGIEDAADSVLGDELADLKRAKRELAELSQQLQKEMAASKGGEEQTAATDTQDANDSQESAATEGEKTGEAAGETNQSTESPAESETPSASETPGGEENSSSTGKGKPGLRGGKKRKPNGQASQPGQGTQQPGQSDGGQGGGPGGQGGPLTGGNYSEFVDRLRDVETLLNDPELQTEVARVREQARGIRADFKRHSKLPNWEVVEEDVRQPLVELQRRLAEEISRRESPDALVPTDRDPVPQRYRELVRKYYERLGGGGK